MRRVVISLIAASLSATAFADLEHFTPSDLAGATGTPQHKTVSKNGTTINVSTNDGWLQPLSGTIWDGIWFSAGFITSATYTIDFNGAGTKSFSMVLTAISAASGYNPEIINSFSVIGGGTMSYTVSDDFDVDVSGTSLSNLSLQGHAGTPGGELRLTITSDVDFTGLSFHHSQDTYQVGTVIHDISFPTAGGPPASTVPLPAQMLPAAAALGLIGAARLRRR
jgi:hypothetical protein